MCNGKTKPECYRYRVFGLQTEKLKFVEKIKPGSTLFLFDFDFTPPTTILLKWIFNGILKTIFNNLLFQGEGYFSNFECLLTVNLISN